MASAKNHATLIFLPAEQDLFEAGSKDVQGNMAMKKMDLCQNRRHLLYPFWQKSKFSRMKKNMFRFRNSLFVPIIVTLVTIKTEHK